MLKVPLDTNRVVSGTLFSDKQMKM